MGLLDKIKKEAAKSGSNKSKIFYLKDGQKARVRFLDDMDDGMEIVFHDSYEAGVNVPCQEQLGRSCEYCDDDTLRTRSQYAWTVYDYESKQVKIMLYAVNNCTPVGALMAMYETYGTLTDRDYVLSVSGKGSDKTFSVVPMDKNKFRNPKAKPLSEETIFDIIDKAFPADDNEEEEEKPKKSGKKKPPIKGKKSSKKKDEDNEEDELPWQDEDEVDESEVDYEEMSAPDLYKLCKERDIEVEKRKPEKYYIRLLQEYDEAQDDWSEEDGDDEW